MTDQPSTTEPMPVQLTRIEGTINLIAYQMTEVKAEVGRLANRVTTIEHAQAQAAGQSGFLRSWLPTIIAAIGVATALGFGIKFG